MTTKTPTKAQGKELEVWKTAFSDEEVSDGFEVELGFFASFPYLIKNDNGIFEAVNTGSGEVEELGKAIELVPIYTFGSTKLPKGITEGLSMDDYDKWTDEQKESAAVTYGSLKEGSDSYSLGSFAGNEQYEAMVKSVDLGTALKKRFYIVALMPKKYRKSLLILSFGITAKKPWSSYANMLKADRIAPPAVMCKVTLQKEKHKTKDFTTGLFFLRRLRMTSEKYTSRSETRSRPLTWGSSSLSSLPRRQWQRNQKNKYWAYLGEAFLPVFLWRK